MIKLQLWKNLHRFHFGSCRINGRLFHSSSGKVSEKDTITQLLYNIGSKKEVDQYLRQFSSVESQKFAIIKVGGAVLTDDLDKLVSSLSFLYRVGLYPIVIHGAGPQLNDILATHGIQPKYVDGIRNTDAKTLEIARQVFRGENLKLVEALESHGTRAYPIIGGVYEGEFLDASKYGLVGKITKVHKTLIETAIRSQALPIVTSLAETPSGQILNVNADTAAGELAKALQPLKVIFLNSSGGMNHPVTQEKLSVINMDEDYENLKTEFGRMEKKGTLLKLNEIKALLDSLPRTSSVAITSAEHLSKELFTEKGAGTLLKRGQKLFKISLGSANKDKLLKLIENDEFNGKSSSRKEILQLVEQKAPGLQIYVDENYNVGAIVSTTEGDVPVLKKILATKSAIVHNVPDNIWSILKKDYPEIKWSAPLSDPMSTWYFENSDGCFRSGPSRTFYTGSPQKMLKRQFSSASGKKRVGLIGARGYTGQEIISLIDGHPGFRLSHISSRENEGKTLSLPKSKSSIVYSNFSPEDAKKLSENGEVDAWILALPNGVGKPFVDAMDSSKKKSIIVDLSADYRFDSSWLYGLPELYNTRKLYALKKYARISNPGCYATGAQLALFPFYKNGLIHEAVNPVVVGISGYSGAGTKQTKRNSPETLKDNLIPYSLTGHIHEREISYHLAKQGYCKASGVNFIPHVAPFFRGITLTVDVTLSKSVKEETLRSLFKDTYTNDKLVTVLESDEGTCEDGIPLVRDVAGNHGVFLGGFKMGRNGSEVSQAFGAVKEGKRAVVIATIDNLLKGAATQAVQNLNLAFQYSEYEGIVP